MMIKVGRFGCCSTSVESTIAAMHGVYVKIVINLIFSVRLILHQNICVWKFKNRKKMLETF